MNILLSSTLRSPKSSRGTAARLSAVLLALACASTVASAANITGVYVQTNLVSDLPDIAQIQDTNLVNAWGISFSAASPFWVSDNGTGLATLYAVTNDSSGDPHALAQGLKVTIPGDGNPTGQLFDGAGHFHGDIFIFASEDGTISGWRGALGTMAEVLTVNSNAVYKGITMSSNANGPVLLAANFHEGTLDEYDTNLTLVQQFMDPAAPDGYAPFNVQALDGMVFVTFAKQDAGKHDDVGGRGHGLLDVFDPQTGMFHRLATGSDAGGHLRQIDSPWGLAIAPASFGRHADQLLVGNFGSGTIMSFDSHGKFRGLLQGLHERPLVIQGLWGLAFGNGGKAGTPDTLFFTAGPDGESHGLFGAITPAPERHHRHHHDMDGGHKDNDHD